MSSDAGRGRRETHPRRLRRRERPHWHPNQADLPQLVLENSLSRQTYLWKTSSKECYFFTYVQRSDLRNFRAAALLVWCQKYSRLQMTSAIHISFQNIWSSLIPSVRFCFFRYTAIFYSATSVVAVGCRKRKSLLSTKITYSRSHQSSKIYFCSQLR